MKNKVAALLKNKHLLIIAFIVFLGIFLRFYHFSNWLHFELDQSRDAKVINLATQQGIGNLPLLGPKAAGSFLRLGPIFYYFEYLGAKIFGNTPIGIAIPTLIFSILTLPIFYLFIRRYFNKKISTALLFIFSISLFMIMYSRFAWNPNNLPFFILLAFYALLRAVDIEEKNKGWWLIICSFSVAIATQLHFIALIAIPIIISIFLILKKPKIKLIFWIASLLVFLFFYIPPIINDIKTGGENIKEFKKVFIKKSTKDRNTLIEKAIRNYTENANGYFLILTSNEKSALPKAEQTDILPTIICDEKCKSGAFFGIIAFLFFTSGIILLALNIFKYWKEKESPRKDFLMLLGLWFGLSLIVFTPLAYDLAPRFFLLIAGIPFIFFGFILNLLEKNAYLKNIFYVIFVILIILISVSNFSAIKTRFSELKNAPFQNFKISPDKILNENNRVTLEQQYLIADYIENIYQKNKFPVYINSEAYYRRAIIYNLQQRGVVSEDIRDSQIAKTIYRNGNYFLIYPTSSNLEARTEDYLENYQIVNKVSFGTLRLFELKPRETSINANEQIFSPKGKPLSAQGVPVRCRWNEIFHKCNSDETMDTDSK